MVYDFEIIALKWHHNRGDFIFAKHLGDTHDFEIPDGSMFGDTAIYKYNEMYPLKNADGIPQFDIFVLRPVSLKWLAKNQFIEGQLVKLII